MKVNIDQARCSGHAQCAVAASLVFALDDLGYAISPAGEVPARQEEQVRAAAEACPERAIRLS